MSDPITEFVTFTPRDLASHPSAPFGAIASTLLATPGVESLHTGPQHEDPATHLLAIRWTSHAAFTAFAASDRYTPWLADLKALLAGPPRFHQVRLAHAAAAAAVLTAPCTEIMTAYDIGRPLFPENLRLFSERMAAACAAQGTRGWHANAHGEVTTPIAREVDGTPGPAAVLLIGWDSVEDHALAKGGPGPILDNIELIRTGRKDVTLHHYNLEQL
ncbi:hypothetical protein HYQ45_010138 [Verticillium longisporum]|uniref:ABM domain-containing protein n=2 Tax=Verticillium longisporum TaxID=100787 RepID=A0A0G4LBQ4_VERLO|nr:hypothetical protein HYQ44_000796 [Verticillium longisporum]KAG7131211.1 hypothetical protein HYQ45_010138 [Verticillium longisporum]CRK19371.1 hypothetical protein BN1708_012617 [Verticillium longisporum]